MATYRLSRFRRGTSPVSTSRDRRLGPEDLDAEAGRHHRDQRQHERFDRADAEALEPQQQQRIGGGDQHADQQRNVEQQVEADGRAQTSARSQAAMAISHSTHSARLTGRG